MLVGPCGGGKTAIYHRVRAWVSARLGGMGLGLAYLCVLLGRSTIDVYPCQSTCTPTAAVRGAARDGHVDGGVGGAGRAPGRRARGAVRKTDQICGMLLYCAWLHLPCLCASFLPPITHSTPLHTQRRPLPPRRRAGPPSAPGAVGLARPGETRGARERRGAGG